MDGMIVNSRLQIYDAGIPAAGFAEHGMRPFDSWGYLPLLQDLVLWLVVVRYSSDKHQLSAWQRRGRNQ